MGMEPMAERFRAWQITKKKNAAQNTYWKNGANPSVKSNPRLRIEAGWYVADRIEYRLSRRMLWTVENVLKKLWSFYVYGILAVWPL